ncbi:LUD domain-containing protein [Haloglomus litoreum]|uniref:LUD domain-containing protein n=1 Tax=Haloglomus litoreum TaxID=3034026 RepID=UPI0023E7589E|nr:LUD domain-containing protein [Haloglomus sp. DT116]
MAASDTGRFTDALADLDVGWTRATAAEWPTVLTKVVEPPAVGAALPHEGVSLDASEVDVEMDPSLEDLRAARTGVTGAALGIADYGSVVLRTDEAPLTEAASLFVDHHVAVLGASDVRPDMAAALETLGPVFREEDADAIVATGPSATADMGALVRGAHGPETVHVVLLTDR